AAPPGGSPRAEGAGAGGAGGPNPSPRRQGGEEGKARMQGEVALAATNTEIASLTRPDARDAKAATRGPFQAPRQPIGAKADAVVAVLNRQAETRRGRQHRAGASRCCASGDRGPAGQ